MKLRLKIEELQVEAFATAATERERGTVQAHSGPPNCYSGDWSCIPEASCGETCPLSCNPSCVATDAVCCPDS